MKRFRIVLATVAAVTALSAGVASADALLVTPSVGKVGGSSGAPCVFVGSATIGNPFSGGTIFSSDPRTGVYTRCPY